MPAPARRGQAAVRLSGRSGQTGGKPPSTLTPGVRRSVRATLLKAGRWLEAEHPEAADPAAWTRQTCAAWVAAVDRMNVGDYAQRTAAHNDRVGKPLQAPAKAAQLFGELTVTACVIDGCSWVAGRASDRTAIPPGGWSSPRRASRASNGSAARLCREPTHARDRRAVTS